MQPSLVCPAHIYNYAYSVSDSKEYVGTYRGPWGFPGGLDGKESAFNTGDLGSIPGLGRSPGEGHGKPSPIFLTGETPWTEEPGKEGLQRNNTGIEETLPLALQK